MCDKKDDWKPKEFRHHSKRRRKGHDYYGKGIYHITINKATGAPYYGELKGDPRIAPGNPGCATVERGALGSIIARHIRELPMRYPFFQLYQYVVMPDHIHILINKKERTEHHLCEYLGQFKGRITKEWRNLCGDAEVEAFEEGLNDRYLHQGRKLDTVFSYIRENPHRLAMRKLRPEFFRKRRNLEICGERVVAYGNLFLLRNPWISQVVVHRADTPEQLTDKLEDWIENAVNEGAVVSPFISKAEKDARRAIEDAGGNIILIQHEAIGERWKPAERDFNLCCEGRLLILSLEQKIDEKLSRRECMRMNALAAKMVEGVVIANGN